jgi:hypothetical protein
MQATTEMEIDKFGRTSIHLHRKHKLNVEHIEYDLSEVNVKRRRITNLKQPIHKNDAASKEYVDQEVASFIKQRVSSKTEQLELVVQQR